VTTIWTGLSIGAVYALVALGYNIVFLACGALNFANAGILAAIRDAGVTVVLVEHNFDLVLRLADVIYVLAQGRLIAAGTPAEIRANAEVERIYLGRTPDGTMRRGFESLLADQASKAPAPGQPEGG
jgi:branched-subunit amino acid ABC-type transport system permease component